MDSRIYRMMSRKYEMDGAMPLVRAIPRQIVREVAFRRYILQDGSWVSEIQAEQVDIVNDHRPRYVKILHSAFIYAEYS